jgi:hypothetical protein
MRVIEYSSYDSVVAELNSPAKYSTGMTTMLADA